MKRRGSARAGDRFDRMDDGELMAESMMLWCSRGVDRWGYTAVDVDLYAEWREWSMTVTPDDLRDWVRANSSHEDN